MKIFDKAAWQIDGGIPTDVVVKHFNIVFTWLDKHEMLSDEGREEFEDGIDDCASLNEDLVTPEGSDFLDKNYDNYLKVLRDGKYGKDFNAVELEKIYLDYKS